MKNGVKSWKARLATGLLCFGVGCLVSYCVYVAFIFSKGIEHQVLTAVSDDAYPWIADEVALAYLTYGPQPEMRATEEQSALSFTLAGCGIDDRSTEEHCRSIIEVLQTLLERGADIEARNGGLTLLHEAVLFDQAVMVQFLLAQGANSNALIQRPDSKVDGFNAIEFARFLQQQRPEQYEEIISILNDWSKRNKKGITIDYP
jgi:hypothetical protein